MKVALAASVLLAFTTPLLAEPLTVERAVSAPALGGSAPGEIEFVPSGDAITYLDPQSSGSRVLNLWQRPNRGGEAKVLVRGADVDPNGRGVADYAWDHAGKRLLITAAGRLYFAEPGGRAPTALTEAGIGASEARFSPRGSLVTYVRDQNLHVIDVASGTHRAITTDGKDTVSYGVAEYIADQDLYRSSGYWTSPDDRMIAFARVDDAGVDKVVRLDQPGATGDAVVEQRYPRPGRPNANVELYVSPTAGRQPVKVDLGGDADIYIGRVDWSQDAKTLYVQRQSRDQGTLDLLAVDPTTGASKVLVREQRTPWVRVNDDFKPLANGTFIWGSERTGFRHLYLYGSDGSLKHPITQGDWPVTHMVRGPEGLSPIVGLDEAKGVLYFMASKDTPLEQHLYAVSYLKPGEPRRITSGNGWWSVTVAKNNRNFVGTYSDPQTPPQTALYSIDGKRVSWIAENKLDAEHPYWSFLDHKSYPEFGTLQAEDGQTLHYSITKPYGFDPAKRYPAIVIVYGGPEVTPSVRKSWGATTDQLLTQAGYVLFRIDNRGTSNRGVKFEAPLLQNMGGPEVVDQLLGKRHLASLPYVDPDRIGVMGWSYGGYMTLRLLTEPGSGFKAGAAGAPPTDWRLYQSHYTEHYLGNPATAKDAYDVASVLPRLGELAKPDAARLLLIHGMADDNVLLGHSITVMDSLQKQAIPFELMLYPGESHRVQDIGKQRHLWNTYLEFFDRNLNAGD